MTNTQVDEKLIMDQYLLFNIDVTGSMSMAIQSLNQVLPEIIRMCALTDVFQKVGIIGYGDYCNHYHDNVVVFSGWHNPYNKDLLNFAEK